MPRSGHTSNKQPFSPPLVSIRFATQPAGAGERLPALEQPTMRQKLKIHPEVEAALNAGKPVVALESTLITHGFPQPENIEICDQY